MELLEPGSTAAAQVGEKTHRFFFSGGIEPMLLESCLEQHSGAVAANWAAAGSWTGGRGLWALVQHVSSGLLGTSPHHLMQLLSQLC